MHTNNRKDTAVITANSTGFFVSRDLHLHKNGSDDMYVYIQINSGTSVKFICTQ